MSDQQILKTDIMEIITKQPTNQSMNPTTEIQQPDNPTPVQKGIEEKTDFEVVKNWFKSKNINIQKEEDVEELSFLDEEVRMFNKYKKETGRSIEDFYKMRSIAKNAEQLQDTDDLIKKIIKEENPLAEDEDVLESIFEKKYKMKQEQEEDEFLSEEEIKNIKEHNKKIKSNREELLNKYKEKLLQEAEKYKLPSEKINLQQLKKELKENFKKFVENEKYINFALNDKEVYPFVLDEDTTKNVILSPDEWIESLKAEDGSLDEGKLFRSMIILANYDKILSIVYSQGVEKGKLEILKEQTNPTGRVNTPQKNQLSAQELITALFG